MIEMRKQLSMMKRKVSQIDHAPSREDHAQTPVDHTPSQLGGGAASVTNNDTSDRTEQEESPIHPNVDDMEVCCVLCDKVHTLYITLHF